MGGMKKSPNPATPEGVTCAVCGEDFARDEVRPWYSVRSGVSGMIGKAVPGWSEGSYICHADLSRFRALYVENLLEGERSEMRDLDREVLESLETGQLISQHPDEIDDEAMTFGERMADHVALFGGSWTFILSFVVVLACWITLNAIGLMARPFDPYPFILLNLVLSCIAALQAPVIMMSQKRQETKDRRRAENDYRVNLKAELEIRQLHEKLDHQMAHQWEKLAELQRVQIEILEERSDDPK